MSSHSAGRWVDRIGSKEGDLVLLPVVPGGVEHQHVGTGDQPGKGIAFRLEPLHTAAGRGGRAGLVPSRVRRTLIP